MTREFGRDPTTGERVEIRRNAPTPRDFWSYPAPPAPRAPTGMSESDWQSLSPGMRREIARGNKESR